MRSEPVDPIAELTDFLQRLDLLRDDVQRVLTSLGQVPQAAAVLVDPHSPPLPPRPRSLSPDLPLPGPFQIGDSVTILNPRSFQQSTGVIIGFTSSRFYQVRTPNGSIVLRIARNLRIRRP